MKYVNYIGEGGSRIGLLRSGKLHDLGRRSLIDLLGPGRTDIGPAGQEVDMAALSYLPPIERPSKIICVGLNYVDHVKESPYKDLPSYPAFFPRFSSSLIGHGDHLIRPTVSTEFDFEAELCVIIGTGGRHIPRESALDHVGGYSIFNDASLRDYQFKSPQWTMGKNFDGTGAFGQLVVTPDELPEGAAGLKIETRLNGVVMQSANTNDLIFPVAELIHLASVVLTLEPGDLIVTGTPAGVIFGRNPKNYMKDGDVCEVEIEGIGVLRNVVRDEAVATAR